MELHVRKAYHVDDPPHPPFDGDYDCTRDVPVRVFAKDAEAAGTYLEILEIEEMTVRQVAAS